MYVSSSQSESEETPNDVQPGKKRRARSLKPGQTSSNMNLEEFGLFSDYAEKKKQCDDPNKRKLQQQKNDTSDDSDPPECICWDVAARRVARLRAELCDARKELMGLYEENQRLKMELKAKQHK